MSQTAIKIKTVSGPSFAGCLDRHGLGPLRRERLRELQVNVGRLCNQACPYDKVYFNFVKRKRK